VRLAPIRGLILRNVYLHKRSLPRLMEIVFWPVMDLMVWGYVSVWMRSTGAQLPRAVDFLLGALVLWTVLYRAQLGVTVAFLEDIWARNFVNVFVTPVSLSELLAATGIISAAKALATGAFLVPIAWLLYGTDVLSLGAAGVWALLVLLLMGWSLGIVTTALILRYGHAAEALAWGIPFLIQPISAVFYPVSVLPVWLRPVSLVLPSTHVFEALRSSLDTGRVPAGQLALATALVVPLVALAAWFFRRQFAEVRRLGLLARAGEAA
jgi:ABC-2 type transport system permease protein